MHPAIYNTIGTDYNSTRVADPYLAERLIDLLKPIPGKNYLDIGCGTGNYTIALTEKGLSFTGIDPSDKMLTEAQGRNDRIKWLKGPAEQIPAADHVFDGAIGTLTIHHWYDLHKGFKEISRVLNANGKLILFTSTPEQMKGYWLNHYFPRMLQDSILQMPSLEQISEAIHGTGLELINTETYEVKDNLQDHFLYAGKNRPELYLNEQVRKGISSFSSLANRPEVESGLKTLEQDIQNGNIESIKQRFEQAGGDYLFVELNKTG